MNWHKLESLADLEELTRSSFETPKVLFKHSTRCSISSMALSRMQPGVKDIDFYLLDIIANRELSNQVAHKFNVSHQSPQLLIVYKGESRYDTSHLGISSSVVDKQIGLLQ
jgi:bacillithiol system protein YtxJ